MGSRKDLSRDLFLVEIEISKEETDFLVVAKDGLANGVENVTGQCLEEMKLY